MKVEENNMANNIKSVEVLTDMYLNPYYDVVYKSGYTKGYRNTKVPKSVLDFIKNGKHVKTYNEHKRTEPTPVYTSID